MYPNEPRSGRPANLVKRSRYVFQPLSAGRVGAARHISLGGAVNFRCWSGPINRQSWRRRREGADDLWVHWRGLKRVSDRTQYGGPLHVCLMLLGLLLHPALEVALRTWAGPEIAALGVRNLLSRV